MRTESADYREGFAAGRDDARAQMDALYDQNYQLESELNQLRARAQRLEAALVLTEDQRDKALKERDEAQRLVASLQNLLENSRREIQAYDVAYYAVIAERDALRKQLDDLRHDYTDKSYWGNT